LPGIDIHKPYRPVTMAEERGAGPAADLAARSAHDEITERSQVLVPADDDEVEIAFGLHALALLYNRTDHA